MAGVNPDGSYSESVPIQIPAGRNGVQPNLSLSYNSNAGNGIAGVGWSLQGLPAITRMNYGRGINYDGQDTYAGPEGRLIDLLGGIYHSENESWSKYEPLGSDGLALGSGNKCGDSACTWKVTDRSGMVYIYGGTNGATVGAIDSSGNPISSGAVRVWALRSVTDLNGNYYEIEYYQDSGQYYPRRIRYTLGGGSSTNYTVTFSYDQSGRPDKEISYAQSSFVQTNWRLSEVLVEAQQPVWWIFSWTVQVRRYAFTYDATGSLLVSRLKKIQEFDSADQPQSATTFTWQNASGALQPLLSPASTNPIAWNNDNEPPLLGDVNGDGNIDIIRPSVSGANYVMLGSGDGHFGPVISSPSGVAYMGWNNSNEPPLLADVNGDGKIDIVRSSISGSNYVMLGMGDGHFGTYIASPSGVAYLGWNNQNEPPMLGDVDGDGNIDIVRSSVSGANYVMLGTGDGHFGTIITSPSGVGYMGWNNDNEPPMLADVNGDGKIDIVRSSISGNNYVMLGMSDGHFGTFISSPSGVAYLGWNNQNEPPILGDVNGDGKIDIVRSSISGANYVMLGVGNGYFGPFISSPSGVAYLGWSNQNEPPRLGDVNGDGKTDIIRSSVSGSNYVMLGAGDGHFGQFVAFPSGVAYMGWSNENEPPLIADVNGDAKADIVRSSISGANYTMLGENTKLQNLISGIAASNGQAITIEYKSLASVPSSVCTGICPAPDGGNLTGNAGTPNTSPRYLVTSVTTTSDRDLDGNGANDSFTTSYEYYNGRVSTGTITERVSLGFEKIKTTDVNSGNYKIDTYNQIKPYHGTPIVSRSYLSNGTLLSEQYAATPQQYFCDETGCTLDATNNPNPTQPKLVLQSGETISKQYINGIQAMVTRSEIISYDSFGNPLETRVTKRLGIDTVVEAGYATYLNSLGDDLHARAIGLPVTSKKCILDAFGTCTIFNTSEDKEYYYDNLPLQQVAAKHQLTSVKTKAGSVTVTKTMTYYPNGNLQTERNDTAAVKTFVFDSDYAEFIEETQLSVPGKPVQVTRQKTDPRYSLPVESTDMNGTKTKKLLDDQGRVSEQLIYAANGTLLRRASFEYHLTNNANPTDHYTMSCTHRKSSPLDNDFTIRDCSYTYTDAMNRKYLTIAPALNGTAQAYATVHTKYDNQGRATHVSAPYFKDTTSAIGVPGIYANTIYDSYGRPWKQTSADGKTIETNILYSGGNLITTQTIAADGAVNESSTNVFGLTKTATQAKGTPLETTINYSYYSNGLLWQVSAPQGLIVIDYYPDTKQQRSITDPNAGTTEYIYETNIQSLAYGKLITETRPAPNGSGNVTVTHEYNDPLARLTRQAYSTGDEVLFTYDEGDVNFGLNRATTTEYKSQGYSYKQRHSYNEFGQELSTRTDIGHATETLCAQSGEMPCHSVVSSAFDEQGRKTKIVYPDLKETTLSYYGNSPHVASITHNGITYATYDGYDVRGKTTGVHYGNGSRTEYTYEPLMGLMTNLKTFDAQNRAIQDLDYAFNAARNIETIDDNVVTDASYSYEYDELQRIRKATRADGKIFNYAFDEKGNLRLKENRTQYFYANSTKLEYSDLATAAGTIRTGFSWSASGNLLQRNAPGEAINYTWSTQNFLIESTRVGGALDGTKTTNIYAGEGNRFLRVYEQPGKQKVKTWDLGGMEIRETWSGTHRDNIQVTKYVYGIDGSRIASITGNPDELIVSATTQYQFTMAEFYGSKSLTGLTAKSTHLFMGCYYFVRELYSRHHIIILTSLAIFVLLLLVLLSRERDEVLRFKDFVRRFAALASIMAFATANCTSGKNDPAFSNAAYYSQVPNLYTGLPSGTAYYHGNHLGSSTLITDPSGLEKIRVHYTTYGEIDQNLSGRWDFVTNSLIHDASQAGDAYLSVAYTGQSYSIEEEMYFYNARFYDPTMGIMISADTIVPDAGDAMGYNRYMYVRGNPIKYSDPTGHNWWSDFTDSVSKAWEDTKKWVSDNAKAIKTVAAVIFNPVAAINGAVALWAGVNAYTHATTGNWLTAAQGWDVASAGAVAGVIAATAFAAGGGAGAFATVGLSGFGAAFVGGMAGGAAGGFTGGALNAWNNGKSFGDGILAGLEGGIIGGFTGAMAGVALEGLSRIWDAIRPGPGVIGDGEFGSSGNVADDSTESLFAANNIKKAGDKVQIDGKDYTLNDAGKGCRIKCELVPVESLAVIQDCKVECIAIPGKTIIGEGSNFGRIAPAPGLAPPNPTTTSPRNRETNNNGAAPAQNLSAVLSLRAN